MTHAYDTIYLSPHPDDAVLSCGGQIFQQTRAGQTVLIVTVATADAPPAEELSPFAQQLHALWELDSEVVARRRAEDEAAAAILGADVLFWPFHDCIYRVDPATGEALYSSPAALFGAVNPADAPELERRAAALRQLPGYGRLLVPLAVGNHVDHQLTRQAAELVFGEDLVYYEDYPYTTWPDALERALSGHRRWLLSIQPLAEEAVMARIAAIAAYHSQLATLFGEADRMAQQLREQVQATGGERLWRRLPDEEGAVAGRP